MEVWQLTGNLFHPLTPPAKILNDCSALTLSIKPPIAGTIPLSSLFTSVWGTTRETGEEKAQREAISKYSDGGHSDGQQKKKQILGHIWITYMYLCFTCTFSI